MSDTSYRKEIEEKDIDAMRNLCTELPVCVTKYVRSIHFTTTAKTKLEYVKDIKHFMEYICEVYTEIPCKSAKDITVDILGGLDKEFFEDYLVYLQKYQKNGKTYTNEPVTVKSKLSALRNFYSYLFMDDFIKSNVIVKVKVPKLKDKEIIRMNENETSEFLNTVESGGTLTRRQAEYHNKLKERDLAITYILLSTGIRVSELVGLNMDDVDFDTYSLKIVRKGGNEAIVYFSDEAAEYLHVYYDKRKQMHPLEEFQDALFLSTRNKRISVRSVEIMIKKYAKKSVPLKHITPHKLRSTYATSLYEQTSDIYLVAENLGHKDITTTRKHYANLSNTHKAESRNKVSFRKNHKK